MRDRLIDKRYRIESRIGEGGMANVYAAIDEKLQRRVAVKVLHKHLASSPDLAKRFFQEAHAISKLEHPNIVKVYDVSAKDSKTLWMVTELLQGQNLAEYAKTFKGRKLNYTVSTLMVREIIKALDCAHAEGIIHRDIKPENVFILDSGNVKLMDFGIAKNLREKSETQTGTFMGSPHYMSPEQVKGGRIDVRSDLYSVGVLFYEAITGKLPFTGKSTHDIVLKITQGRYLEANVHAPEVPKTISRMITKMMNKHKVHRYQKTSSISRDLDRFLGELGLAESHIELERYFQDRERFLERIHRPSHDIAIREDVTHRLTGIANPSVVSINNEKPKQTMVGVDRTELASKLRQANLNAITTPVNVNQDKTSLTPQAPRKQSGAHKKRRDRNVDRSITRPSVIWAGPQIPVNTEKLTRPMRRHAQMTHVLKARRLYQKQQQKGIRRRKSKLGFSSKLMGVLGVGMLLAIFAFVFWSGLHPQTSEPSVSKKPRSSSIRKPVKRIQAPRRHLNRPAPKKKAVKSYNERKRVPRTSSNTQKHYTRSNSTSTQGAVRKPATIQNRVVAPPVERTERVVPVSGPGWVKIQSSPAADIFINGKAMGTTIDSTYSSRWIELKSGTHRLVLRRQGYHTYTQTITVKKGGRVSIGGIRLKSKRRSR